MHRRRRGKANTILADIDYSFLLQLKDVEQVLVKVDVEVADLIGVAESLEVVVELMLRNLESLALDHTQRLQIDQLAERELILGRLLVVSLLLARKLEFE
jgi:hypothetical protein